MCVWGGGGGGGTIYDYVYLVISLGGLGACPPEIFFLVFSCSETASGAI